MPAEKLCSQVLAGAKHTALIELQSGWVDLARHSRCGNLKRPCKQREAVELEATMAALIKASS